MAGLRSKPGLHLKPGVRGKPGLRVKTGLRKPVIRGKLGVHSRPGAGERAFAYAKACGMVGKSFIKERIKILEGVTKRTELDRILFPLETRNLPEKELLVDLEDRIARRAVDSILSIIECFSAPPELLILMLRSYEYADLKNALVSALQRERNVPSWTNIRQYQTVSFNKWPDIQAMLEGTEFEFLLDEDGELIDDHGDIHLETVLDRHYYNALWKSLSSLGASDRQGAEKILSDEISLRNSAWALRLRTYYGMSPEKVKLHLINISSRDKKQSLAHEALCCLDFPLDNHTAWSSWRWKKFLNPYTGEGFWSVDPRYFQNAASIYLFRLACRNFHLRPSSLDAFFCFFKIKQFEEDILTSEAEGLGMGLSSRDTLGVLGVDL